MTNIEIYVEKGAPLEIMHGEYKGRLVDIQPLNDSFVCGIYRYPGGDTIGGPMIKMRTAK